MKRPTLSSSLKVIFSHVTYHFVDTNKMVVLRSDHFPDIGNMVRQIFYRDNSVKPFFMSMLAQHAPARFIPVGGKWALMTLYPLVANI